MVGHPCSAAAVSDATTGEVGRVWSGANRRTRSVLSGPVGWFMLRRMAKKLKEGKPPKVPAAGRPSALLDTRVVYCGDNLEQLAKLPDACIDLIYIDPPFNSNRNYEVFWGETKDKAILRRPPRFHGGLHRLHASPLRATRPRAEKDRLLH